LGDYIKNLLFSRSKWKKKAIIVGFSSHFAHFSECGEARTLNQWLKRTMSALHFSHPLDGNQDKALGIVIKGLSTLVVQRTNLPVIDLAAYFALPVSYCTIN
jgi:hypothetical protein